MKKTRQTKKVQRVRSVIKTRRIQKMGNSLYVALPSRFARSKGLLPGDEMLVISRGEWVQMIPMRHDLMARTAKG